MLFIYLPATGTIRIIFFFESVLIYTRKERNRRKYSICMEYKVACVLTLVRLRLGIRK